MDQNLAIRFGDWLVDAAWLIGPNRGKGLQLDGFGQRLIFTAFIGHSWWLEPMGRCFGLPRVP